MENAQILLCCFVLDVVEHTSNLELIPILNKWGFVITNQTGCSFDPAIHQTIDNTKPKIVSKISKKGLIYKGTIIRKAQVS